MFMSNHERELTMATMSGALPNGKRSPIPGRMKLAGALFAVCSSLVLFSGPAQAGPERAGLSYADTSRLIQGAEFAQYRRGYRRAYRGRGYYGPRYGHRYGHRRYYRRGPGAAAVIGGLAAGALIGGAIASQAGPGAVAPSSDAVAYCARRFKSYDPRSGTYLGYDGQRHPCP